MNLKERVLNRLQGKSVDITPVGSTTTYGCVCFMKGCNVTRPAVDTDPKALALMALAGHYMGGFDWIKAMGSDITAVSHTLGCEVKSMAQDSPYVITSHPYAEKSVDELDVPDNLLSLGRLPAYKEQFRILRDYSDTLAIYGASEGPFTAAANLMDVVNLMRCTIKKPETVEKILQVTTETLVRFVKFAAENGADYYTMAEPTTSPDLFSPKFWQRFVAPCIKRIVDESPIPIVLHICGKTDPIIGMMCDTGVAGISIEEKADMKKAVEIAHAKGVTVFGNVATASTLFTGTPEEVYAESTAALENGVDFLCPGCGIGPNSPLDNIIQLRRARDARFDQPVFHPQATVSL